MTAFLLNHLWQSTLFAFGVGLLSLTLGANSARHRYWLWFAASLKFLVPLSIFSLAGEWLGARLAAPMPVAESVAPLVETLSPFAPSPSARPAATPFDAANLLIGAWIIVALVLAGVWVARWRS